MPYRPRYEIIFDGAIFHVTWMCHNKDWLLKFDWAKQLYYDLLLAYKDKFKVCFYSYHFMDNHIHLSGKINGTKEDFSHLFRIVNSILAKRVNKELKRRGQVILDRFKSPLIQSDKALLSVMTYQDLNSWRAGKVDHPKKYTWSSYRYYAYGEEDQLLTPAPSYLGMGEKDEERRRQYRRLVLMIMEMDGEAKKNYSRVCFIGDPDWVIQKDRILREKLRIKREAYLRRQRRQYSQHSPP